MSYSFLYDETAVALSMLNETNENYSSAKYANFSNFAPQNLLLIFTLVQLPQKGIFQEKIILLYIPSHEDADCFRPKMQ